MCVGVQGLWQVRHATCTHADRWRQPWLTVRCLVLRCDACRSNVGSNQLKGALPWEWAQGMDSLRVVNVTNNLISGSLPKEWANMTSMQSL